MNRPKQVRLVASWLAAAYIAWTVVPMGWVKCDPDGFWTPAFERWGYPGWLRIAVGVFEVAGGLALLVPRLTVYAAAAVMAVLLGAWVTRFNDGRYTDVAWLTLYLLLLSWIALEYRVLRWRGSSAAP